MNETYNTPNEEDDSTHRLQQALDKNSLGGRNPLGPQIAGLIAAGSQMGDEKRSSDLISTGLQLGDQTAESQQFQSAVREHNDEVLDSADPHEDLTLSPVARAANIILQHEAEIDPR